MNPHWRICNQFSNGAIIKMKCAFVLCCIVALAVAGFPPKPSEILKDLQNKIEKLDKACAPIFPMKGLNLTWMNSVDKWYVTGSDRPIYELFLGAVTSPAAVKRMDEKQKLQACIPFSINRPEQTSFKSDEGETKFFRAILNPVRIGESDWTVNVNGKEEYLCANTILDSDNESYFIAYDYWPNGQRGIWVASSEKTVPQKVHDLAMEKLELLAGFTDAKEHYIIMDNSKCN